MHQELRQLRSEIDAVDSSLRTLLAKRYEIIERVAACKAGNGVPARIPNRIMAVISHREAAGVGLGLPRRAAARIWEIIVEEACRHEERLIENIRRDNSL